MDAKPSAPTDKFANKPLSVQTGDEQAVVDVAIAYRALVEEQAEFISLAKADGELVYVNPAYARHFGLTSAQMIGANLFDFVDPAHREGVRNQIDAVLSSGERHFNENRMVAIDGTEKWVAWTNSLQRDGLRQVLLHSVGRDITERHLAERSLRELAAIVDNSTDYVIQADWRGAMTYMNPAARRATGLGLDEPVAQYNFSEFNTPETNRLLAEVIIPAVKTKGVWVGDATVFGAERRVVPVSHMVLAHRDSSGRIDRYSAVMRDISAEVLAKQELLRQTATLRSVLQVIPALVAVVGVDERYRIVNNRFERWSGLSSEYIIGRTLAEVIGDGEYARSLPWIQRVLAGETVNFEKEYPGRTAERHMAISYIPLWMENGNVDGFVSVAQDITQHKQEEVRLVQLAQRDVLTGLLNRAGFEKFLERTLQSQKSLLALLYIDLDHFKPINDQHGHPVGDEVLQMFAQRLLKLVRPTDAVARLGGDEFAVVLHAVAEGKDAQAVAAKIINAASEQFQVGSRHLQIGASVGFALSGDTGADWRDLVKLADQRLYAAKAAGRGRHSGPSG